MTGSVGDGSKASLHDVVCLTRCPHHAAPHAHPFLATCKGWCCKGLGEEICRLLVTCNVLWVNLSRHYPVTQHRQVSTQVFALRAHCHPLHQMHRTFAVTRKRNCMLLAKHGLEEETQPYHLLGCRLCCTKLCCTTRITSSFLSLCLPRYRSTA